MTQLKKDCLSENTRLTGNTPPYTHDLLFNFFEFNFLKSEIFDDHRSFSLLNALTEKSEPA